MIRSLPAVLLALALVVLLSCGEQSQSPSNAAGSSVAKAKPDAATDQAKTPPTAPPDPVPDKVDPSATTPTTTKPPALLDDAAIDRVIAEATDLEQEAKFFEALNIVRDLQREHPSHARSREIDALAARLAETRREAADLTIAVQNHGSNQPEVVRAGRQMLKFSGETAKIMLRQAVRTGEGRLPIEAATTLVEMNDPQAPAVFVERLAQNPPPELNKVLLESLGAMTQHITGPIASHLDQKFIVATGDAKADYAAVLTRLAGQGAAGDAKRFDTLVGREGAFEELKKMVEEAMTSTDKARREWGDTYAPMMDLHVVGLRADYFEGTNFEKLLLSQLEPGVNLPADARPLGDRPMTFISARWTGYINIPTAGKYTFYCIADDGQRVFIGEKKVLEDWNMKAPAEFTGQIELTAGLHPIRVEWMQGDGGYEINLKWSGPGIEKATIPASALRTMPWPGARAAK